MATPTTAAGAASSDGRPVGGAGIDPSPGPAEREQSAPGHTTSGHTEQTVPSIPAQAEGIQLLGTMAGSGYREAPALVRRADGQALQLTPVLYRALEAIDGQRDYDGIAAKLTESVGKRVAPEQARMLVEKKLRPLGVLAGADGAQPVAPKANPLLALRFRVIVSNPTITRRVTSPFAWLFRPLLVLPLLAAFAVTTWWVLWDKGLASPARQAFYQPGLLLTVFALTVLSAGFHEFGHASACRYSGATPGSMGFGIYLVWPAFYTDVSDAYRLDRRRRLWVDLGGLYFNAIFAVATFGLWIVTRWDALLLVLGTQILQMLRQLTPMIRADGYHILADLTGVPDMFAHIKPTLTSVLPRRWRDPRGSTLRPWARAVVIVWVALVVPALAFALISGVLMFPRLVATAWDSLGRQWDMLTDAFSHADVLGVPLRLLSIGAIILPVLGTVLLVVRMVRRVVQRTWKATAGRPGRQAVAVVAALAVLAGVGWAWWPRHQYRPVQPGEQWALRNVSALPAAAFARTAPAVAGQRLVGASTAEPAMLLVPRPDPAAPNRPALLMLRPPGKSPELLRIAPNGASGTPTSTTPGSGGSTSSSDGSTGSSSGSGTQTWPFPFPPPPPAQAGDNRTIAVNTEDGRAIYDTAFSLVFVKDADVTQRNEAFAYANCSNCRTVAVSFQAIFILGRSDVVTPVNSALAVNYKCTTCDTSAVAVQVVASLTALPDQATMTKLLGVFQQLDQLRQELPQLTAQQIYARLTAAETSILDALAQGGPAVIESAGGTQASGTQPTGTAAGGASPAPEATTSSAPAGTQPSSGPATDTGSGQGTTGDPGSADTSTGTSGTGTAGTGTSGTADGQAPATDSQPSPAPSSSPVPQPASSSDAATTTTTG